MYRQAFFLAITACIASFSNAAPHSLNTPMVPSIVTRNLKLSGQANDESQDVLTSKGLESFRHLTSQPISNQTTSVIEITVPQDSILSFHFGGFLKHTLESLFIHAHVAKEEGITSCHNTCSIGQTIRAWLIRSPSSEDSSTKLRPCSIEECPELPVQTLVPRADNLETDTGTTFVGDSTDFRPCTTEGCPPPPCPVGNCLELPAPSPTNPRSCPVEGCPGSPTPTIIIPPLCPVGECPGSPTPSPTNPRPCPVEGCPGSPVPTTTTYPRPCPGIGCPPVVARFINPDTDTSIIFPRDLHAPELIPCPRGAKKCPGVFHHPVNGPNNLPPLPPLPILPCPLNATDCPGLPHQTLNRRSLPTISPLPILPTPTIVPCPIGNKDCPGVFHHPLTDPNGLPPLPPLPILPCPLGGGDCPGLPHQTLSPEAS